MRKIAQNSRRTRRLAYVAVAGLTIALIPATNADATIFATTTTVTATPATSVVGTAVTLKATVKVTLGLAAAQGSVSFTSKNASGATANLGTVAGCNSSTCTATLVTTGLPLGSTSVTATYAAYGLTAGSSGSTAVTVNPNTAPGTSQTVTCYSGQPCNTGTVTSSDSKTQLQVSSTPSSGNQTVHGDLGPGTLHCQPAGNEAPDNDGDDDDGVFVGALATFSSTAADSTKTITYTGMGMTTGSTGWIMNHQYGEHPHFLSCYGQDTPWNGFTAGSYGPAPFNATDQLYVAMLPRCGDAGITLPCATNVKNGSTSDSYIIKTAAGDPKNIG